MSRRLALACAVAIGCHHAPPATPRALAPVATVDARDVTSVVELDDNLYVFDRTGVTVLRAGAVVARDELDGAGPASTIPAPGGDGRWVMRALWRVAPDGQATRIDAERLGLTPAPTWTAIVGAGATTVATSATALAIADDGHHVALYPPTPATDVAVARGRVAFAGATGVDVWDLAAGTQRGYPLGGAHVAFLSADGADGAAPELVAWTADRLVLEGDDGALRPVPLATPITAAVASGRRLWLVAGGRLTYLDRGGRAPVATAIPAAPERLFASPSGDVWVASGGHLARYSADAAAPRTAASDPTWTAQIAPVFARVCAHCHLPDGSSGVDLSTPGQWRDERGEIRHRVLEARSMPPAGTAMSDADRAAVAAWLDAK